MYYSGMCLEPQSCKLCFKYKMNKGKCNFWEEMNYDFLDNGCCSEEMPKGISLLIYFPPDCLLLSN